MKREPKNSEKYLITQHFSQTYEHTKENYCRNGKPPLSLCLLCVSFVMICVTYIVQRRDISGQVENELGFLISWELPVTYLYVRRLWPAKESCWWSWNIICNRQLCGFSGKQCEKELRGLPCDNWLIEGWTLLCPFKFT